MKQRGVVMVAGCHASLFHFKIPQTLASLQSAHVLFVFFPNNCIKSQLKACRCSFSSGSIEWHQQGALPSIRVKNFSIWESVKWPSFVILTWGKLLGMLPHPRTISLSALNYTFSWNDVEMRVLSAWHISCVTIVTQEMRSFSAVFLVFHSLSTLFLWNN